MGTCGGPAYITDRTGPTKSMLLDIQSCLPGGHAHREWMQVDYGGKNHTEGGSRRPPRRQ